MHKAIHKIKQCTILYIESDSKISNSMLKLYNALFKEVLFATNGKDGLNLFSKNNLNIDVIITDVELPLLSGIDMISTIRRDFGYKHSVIFTTNITNDQVLLKCLKLGASDYLIKPILHKTHLGILIRVLKPIYDTKRIHIMNQELELYQKFADSKLLISKTDLDGTIIYVNNNFVEISGYSKEELLGSPHNIVRHHDMPKEAFYDLWKTIRSGKVWSGNVQNRSKNGASYYVEAKIFPIMNNENNIIEYISFRQDVTSHIKSNNIAKHVLKKTKLSYSKVYEESIEKARLSVSKELNNLEFAINLERDNSKKQASKRLRAEDKLNETTDEKNKEILYWKTKLANAGKTLTYLSSTNKKNSQELKKFSNTIDSVENKLDLSQSKILELQQDKERLFKTIEDKDDVIKHLEDEVHKYKNLVYE